MNWKSAARNACSAAVTVTCAVAMSGIGQVEAQETGKTPRFETVSVRPAGEYRALAGTPTSWGSARSHVTLQRVALRAVLQKAYGLESYQLSGPSWLDTEFFTIAAKVPADTLDEQIPLMYQALLTERFGLKFHRESKVMSVLAIVVRKGGPILRKVPGDQTEVETKSGLSFGSAGEHDDGTMTTIFAGDFGTTHLTATGTAFVYGLERATMADVAKLLSRVADRGPVVDKTGLQGHYEIEFAVDRSAGKRGAFSVDGGPWNEGSASDPAGPRLGAALRKLGLELVREQTPVDVFVIDHIYRSPTEN